jgi:hypothetical protein
MAIKYKVNVNHINVQAAPTAKVIESELATNYRYLKRMKVPAPQFLLFMTLTSHLGARLDYAIA